MIRLNRTMNHLLLCFFVVWNQFEMDATEVAQISASYSKQFLDVHYASFHNTK